MASADYRLCDVCHSKAFYDGNLNYDFDNCDYETGAPKLEDVDAMKVLCDDCAKTHMEKQRALEDAIAPVTQHSDSEKLALWMTQNGFATGHGDTFEDLLGELGCYIEEIRNRRLKGE
jgi:hypothetical protein